MHRLDGGYTHARGAHYVARLLLLSYNNEGGVLRNTGCIVWFRRMVMAHIGAQPSKIICLGEAEAGERGFCQSMTLEPCLIP